MKQEIKLDESQTKHFHTVVVGMKFIDAMKAKGYTEDQAFTALTQIMGGK
jgi:hypothetical protein